MINSFIELPLFNVGANYKAEKGDIVTIRLEHIISFTPGTPYEIMDLDGNKLGTTIELSSGRTYCVYEDYYEIFRKVVYGNLSKEELEEAQKKCEHEWGPTETKITKVKNVFEEYQVISRTCKKCGFDDWQSAPYYGPLESEG